MSRGESNLNFVGINWDPYKDIFRIELKSVLENLKLNEFTKWFVQQVAAMIFDQVGFVILFTVQIKYLLQEIWILGID